MNKESRGLRDDELPGMRGQRIVKLIVRIILWIFVLLILDFFLLTFFGYVPEQFVVFLLFGWIVYLHRVLPEITFNPEIAFDAAVALVLAIFGLHCILRTLSKPSAEKPAVWRFGWTLKIAVMVLLLFATSIASIGMVHQIAWLCREPELIEMLGISKETIELNHVKQVAVALKQFANDNQGQFPKKLDDLFPTYVTTRKLFFTRAMDDDPPQPFIYYAGYSDRDNEDTIILASPRLYGHTRVVGYLDTRAKIIPDVEFQQDLQKQQNTAHSK